MDSISLIYDKIYISGFLPSIDLKNLKKNKIKAVLHLGQVEKPKHILQKYKDNDIDHMFLILHKDLVETFSIVAKYVNYHLASRHRILIHCTRGVNRSPSVVALYLLYKIHNERFKANAADDLILDDIIYLLKTSRPCVKPDKYFLKQLHDCEKKMVNIGK